MADACVKMTHVGQVHWCFSVPFAYGLSMKRAVESGIIEGNPTKKPAWPEMHKLAELWRLYKTVFPWPKPREICGYGGKEIEKGKYVWIHPDKKGEYRGQQPTGAEEDIYVKHVCPCYSLFDAVHVVAGRFLAHMAYKKKEWKLPKGKAARDEVLLDFVGYCLEELRTEVNVHATQETGGEWPGVWKTEPRRIKYTWDATQSDKRWLLHPTGTL